MILNRCIRSSNRFRRPQFRRQCLASKNYPAFAPRHFSSRSDDPKSGTVQEEATGPNQDVLPHVSEEAAALSEITGETGPELEQGTPVGEVLKRDSDAKKKAPEIIKQNEKLESAPTSSGQASRKDAHSQPSGKRSYSTAAELQVTQILNDVPELYRFEEPEIPEKVRKFTKRYDPLLDQMTNEMMRDGKKQKAQRYMQHVLTQLRTSEPPSIDPRRPLAIDPLTPEQLPQNPVSYLTAVVDSLSPLIRIRFLRGAAGGGASLPMASPINLRQRRKRAICWIIEAAQKRAWRGSGKMGFPQRIADEVRAVAEGRSALWDKRRDIHKMGVAARANSIPQRRGRRIRL